MQPKNKHQKHLYYLGERIKSERHLQGKNEEMVAQATGISQPTLSRIENGRHDNLKFTTLIDLFDYLDIPLTEIHPALLTK